jgi:hypothetical protein
MSNWVPTIQDFDKCLLEMLSQITVDIDGQGNRQPVHVTYFTPEPENSEDRTDLRPAIVLFMYDETPDIKRESSYITTVVNDTPTDVTLKKIPTPIKYFYQFTILTDYQQHMNEIMAQFHQIFPRRGYISLDSPENEAYEYDFFLRGLSNGYTNQFLEYGANEQERIFRRIYKYVLYAETDENPLASTYKKVTDGGVKTNINNTNP